MCGHLVTVVVMVTLVQLMAMPQVCTQLLLDQQTRKDTKLHMTRDVQENWQSLTVLTWPHIQPVTPMSKGKW